MVLKLAPDYYPQAIAVNGHVVVKGRGKYESLSGGWVDCEGGWNNNIFTGPGWTNSLSNVSAEFDGCGALSGYKPSSLKISIAAIPEDLRIGLLKDKELVAEPDSIKWTGGYGSSICREREPIWDSCTSKVKLKLGYEITGPAITEAPYLRRDRFWKATPWESGNLVEGLTGANSFTGKSLYGTGCKVTETETMAYTLGSKIGAEYSGISAEVSGSLTKTFGTAVTVSRDTVKSFSRTMNGIEGKRTRFILWVLMERYSFTNADGSPFRDENYTFEEGTEDLATGKHYLLEISGGQAEPRMYIFDMESDKLLGNVSVP